MRVNITCKKYMSISWAQRLAGPRIRTPCFVCTGRAVCIEPPRPVLRSLGRSKRPGLAAVRLSACGEGRGRKDECNIPAMRIYSLACRMIPAGLFGFLVFLYIGHFGATTHHLSSCCLPNFLGPQQLRQRLPTRSDPCTTTRPVSRRLPGTTVSHRRIPRNECTARTRCKNLVLLHSNMLFLCRRPLAPG